MLAAIDLHRMHRMSFRDALVVRAAKEGGCSVLYRKEFEDGRSFDGVRIVNPFR